MDGPSVSQKKICFLFQDPQDHQEITSFLKPFYAIESEPLDFSFEELKTKDLHKQIQLRLEKYGFDFLLIQHDQLLELFDAEKRRIRIDFDLDKLNYQRKVIAKDPFLRAIGRNRTNVLDVSAGLAIDAVFLAQHGHSVTAVERNPLLFTLLSYAKKRSENLSRLKINFEFADANKYVQEKVQKDQFDCIYFDPMFPDKAKTALPKQEMVLFRQLVGNDQDAEAVVETLLKTKTRVVVKRPAHAGPVLPSPANAFESKLIRFDIYEGK
jgi:16S rRNA (guanine1516-N2)-methyltransferase